MTTHQSLDPQILVQNENLGVQQPTPTNLARDIKHLALHPQKRRIILLLQLDFQTLVVYPHVSKKCLSLLQCPFVIQKFIFTQVSSLHEEYFYTGHPDVERRYLQMLSPV